MTQGVHSTSVHPWLVRWARQDGTRDFCACLDCSIVGPVQNISFLTGHFFNRFVPIACQAGQSVVPHHLSLNK
jgi:hypothetical protein